MSVIDWPNGRFSGEGAKRSVKRLGDLEGVFDDLQVWQALAPETVVYSVAWEEKIKAGTEGGLLWGVTIIEPGRVGDEYFMTRGHFHAKRDRGEYYTTVQGEGILVLMDEDRAGRVETMSPGSLHYIPGHTAHRTVNTGDTPLIFWACWPSDAGHDYDTIAKYGFSSRVIARNGTPEVVQQYPDKSLLSESGQ
jgi:glucose-6-phosphate isomerase